MYDEQYRQAYLHDLKREIPRIPFYPNFRQWAVWGKQLLDLHLNYEAALPAVVGRVDNQSKKPSSNDDVLILKSDALRGTVVIDRTTRLEGIPSAVWDFKLGSRNAVDWILDQSKKAMRSAMCAPKSPARTATEREDIILSIRRIISVSLATRAIVDEMRAADHAGTDDK